MTDKTTSLSRYRISRRGRKLNITDDPKVILAMPKDVPERTWAEVFQKEENDLVVLDIREEILENAMQQVYQIYLEKQNVLFTVHCAAEAWLKLIKWSFFKHDPGEDPASYPPCYIPKRVQSWVPDDPPSPSPKDTWCKHNLNIVEECPEETLARYPSSDSIDYPVVDAIPAECRFPGKIKWPEEEMPDEDNVVSSKVRPKQPGDEGLWEYPTVTSSSRPASETALNAESEVLQKVTDYSTTQISKTSTITTSKRISSVEGSLHGAGDSVVDRHKQIKKKSFDARHKGSSRLSFGRSKGQLPATDGSRSRLSVISDCRLRSLRVDTQYEISSEKVETPPGEPLKRK